MAINLVDPEDQTFHDWIPFIETFDRSCREKHALGEFGHLYFRFPCTTFESQIGAEVDRHLCNYGIRVQFSDNEVFVSLFDEEGGSLEFGKDSFGTAWESTFGSLIQPDPHTRLGKEFASASGYFEESAIRLIPLLVHAYRISPVEAGKVQTSWSLQFRHATLSRGSSASYCRESVNGHPGI